MSRFKFALCLACLGFAALLCRSSLEAQEVPFATLFDPATPAHQPDDLRWNPAGTALTFLWEDEAGKALWIVEEPEWQPRALLRLGEEREGDEGEEPGEEKGDSAENETGPEAKPKPEPEPEERPAEEKLESLDAYAWSPTGKELVLESDGDLYRLDLASGERLPLATSEEEENAAQYSPLGDHIAFVRAGNLYVTDLASGRERALTTDGDGEIVLNGETDWVYWEELWGRESTGFWWSPDGRRIAFYRFDEAAVEAYPLVNFLPVYPEIQWQKYPKAGTVNPTVRVGVLTLAEGDETPEIRWLETGDPADAYLARVHWMPDGRVAVERLNRDQNHLDLLACVTDSGRCQPLLTETSETWINIGDETHFLSGGRFLWGSERAGWRHLYLYGGDGKLLRALTEGPGDLTSVDAVLEASEAVVVTRHQGGFLGPKDRRVERIALDGSGSTALSQGQGWHEATVAANGRWVHQWSDSDHADRWTLRAADGTALAKLPQSPGSGPDLAKLPSWEYLTVPGPEGSRLPARLLRPAGFQPDRRYPAIVYHYGGPQSQVVTNRWDGRGRDLWHKWMAQRGYAVFMLDNRISDFFGKGGADRAHRRFGPNNLEAQLAGVEYLKSLGWVDPQRLGLWGWSGGGSNTLYCLFNAPGVWKAGVAGAPVTDWRFYDSIWTERYLDRPQDNEEGYRLSSAVTHAAQLKDHLLVVHGTGDDNVHPQNTFALLKVLIDQGLPFEDAIYPRQKHGFKRQPFNHFLQRMTEFFDRHLQPEAAK